MLPDFFILISIFSSRNFLESATIVYRDPLDCLVTTFLGIVIWYEKSWLGYLWIKVDN